MFRQSIIQSLTSRLKHILTRVLKVRFTLYNSIDRHSYTDGGGSTSLENDVEAVARVLTNMLLIGIEKRRTCIYYSEYGRCMYMSFDAMIPGISMVKDGDRWYIEVAKHPEICAVCPYWRRKAHN